MFQTTNQIGLIHREVSIYIYIPLDFYDLGIEMEWPSLVLEPLIPKILPTVIILSCTTDGRQTTLKLLQSLVQLREQSINLTSQGWWSRPIKPCIGNFKLKLQGHPRRKFDCQTS